MKPFSIQWVDVTISSGAGTVLVVGDGVRVGRQKKKILPL